MVKYVILHDFETQTELNGCIATVGTNPGATVAGVSDMWLKKGDKYVEVPSELKAQMKPLVEPSSHGVMVIGPGTLVQVEALVGTIVDHDEVSFNDGDTETWVSCGTHAYGTKGHGDDDNRRMWLSHVHGTTMQQPMSVPVSKTKAYNMVYACNFCSQVLDKPLWCARCKMVNYCGRECQKKDWEQHNPNCKKSPELARARKYSKRLLQKLQFSQGFAAATKEYIDDPKGFVILFFTSPDKVKDAYKADTVPKFVYTPWPTQHVVVRRWMNSAAADCEHVLERARETKQLPVGVVVACEDGTIVTTTVGSIRISH